MDLNNETFLVTFSNDQDYLKALTGGPWDILDHYLVVHPWSPKFRTSDKIYKSVTAWVQLPELPVHFYHREVLFALGNLIGRTVKLDYHTERLERGKFARLAIELDMTQPLPTRIRLDGFWQQVVYENLPQICFDCGRIGHLEDTCPKKQSTVGTMIASGSTVQPTSGVVQIESPVEPPAGYGPWMQVVRKSRKPNRKVSDNQGNHPAKLTNQGKQTAKSTGYSKGDTHGTTTGNDGKGKANNNAEHKKGKSDFEKGKGSTDGGKPTQGIKKSNNGSQEWVPVGAVKDVSNIQSPVTDSGPRSRSPQVAVPNNPTTRTISPSPSAAELNPVVIMKENANPNTSSHSVRQHFEKKNTSGSPSPGNKNDRHLKVAKKPIQNPTAMKREVNQLVKEPTFPITQRDIESFIIQSRLKAEEFGKALNTAVSDVRMEDSAAIPGTKRTTSDQSTLPTPISAD
ncbi:unnamed protein product [Linum trigynum]|uniref:CCHC-type domain-containing protein n=1 Tax=Linum trigynum TaxID=586398 RepID=A0AAV2F412_9ROSI